MFTVNHTASANGGSFSAGDGGLRMGYLSYEWASPEVFAIMHTVVEEAFRGQGVAKALLDAAVSFARENGYKIRPVCPYAEKVLRRDSQYNDILADSI